MSKLVALYIQEIQRPGSGVTLETVPVRLRTQVAEAIAEMKVERQKQTAQADEMLGIPAPELPAEVGGA